MTDAELTAALVERIRQWGTSAAVAFSAGVDSTVVAKLATLALGPAGALCVLARSESNTDEDQALAEAIAQEHGLNLEIIAYSELAIGNYAANPTNRCYFCKSELYGRLEALAAERGFSVVLDGSNADDAGDYRPGLQAVKEKGVRSPLKEMGVGKARVRELARHLGLPNHDRPASPCLSSRIPYGQPVTREKLEQVGRAEAYLRGLGLREFRCRHHGEVARLEVMPQDFAVVVDRRDEIVAEFRRLGFLWVALDLAGFRSGSLNALVAGANPPRA